MLPSSRAVSYSGAVYPIDVLIKYSTSMLFILRYLYLLLVQPPTTYLQSQPEPLGLLLAEIVGGVVHQSSHLYREGEGVILWGECLGRKMTPRVEGPPPSSP